MSILTVANVAKSFAADLLFSEVSFSLAAGQKMGLIGRNGGGKTTLLKIILGQETAEPSILADGTTAMARVSLASGRRMGYLRQEAPVYPEHTIAEEIEGALAPLRAAQARITDAEHRMSEAKSDSDLEAAMTEYTAALDEFEGRGGWAVEAERDQTLLQLGFGPGEMDKRVGSCSGGEQTRLALAKLVMTRPDLLILDEPTNHLDIDATEWLENWVKNYEGAVILVSHDRYFLDAVTDTTAELQFQKLTVYKGNYSHYRRQKEEQLERQAALYKQQQDEIARLNDLIKRNMGANATQSVIRHKTQGRIDRMEKVEAVRTDNRTVRAKIDAAGAGRIGREVVRLSDLSKKFGERTLFSRLGAVIERDDRMGLVGPNGAGKSTIVRIILGIEAPTTGSVTFGNNVRVAYFSQHATDALDTSRTVLEALTDEAVAFTETEARNYLARFLFTGDDVQKTVAMLSGGEKNKLALARMLLTPCNLLILDEPTNHLDIESCETLTEMLQGYSGTLLLVSHDRYLLNAVTTKTLGLTGNGDARVVEGNYTAWREEVTALGAMKALASVPAKPKAKPVPTPNTQPPTPASSLSPRELSRARVKAQDALTRAERDVQTLEAQLSELEARLADPRKGMDMVSLALEHTRKKEAVDLAVTAWEDAARELELLG